MSRIISETVRDRITVTMDDYQQVTGCRPNGDTLDDILNDHEIFPADLRTYARSV